MKSSSEYNKKEKTVKTEKTLDGVTAGFVAAIANALSRKIKEARMIELTADPDLLKFLVLPLVHNEWPRLMVGRIPSLYNYDGLIVNSSLVWFETDNIKKETVRELLKEVYDRKYEPLCESDAKRVAKLICGTAGKSAYFMQVPYLKAGKLHILWGNMVNHVDEIMTDIDGHHKRLKGSTFLFAQSMDCRSPELEVIIKAK